MRKDKQEIVDMRDKNRKASFPRERTQKQRIAGTKPTWRPSNQAIAAIATARSQPRT